MTPSVFYAACLSLWGAGFRAIAAVELKITNRTLRTWLAGDDRIPLGVQVELRDRLTRKLGEISAIRDAIVIPADRPPCKCETVCEGFSRGNQRCQELPLPGAP